MQANDLLKAAIKANSEYVMELRLELTEHAERAAQERAAHAQTKKLLEQERAANVEAHARIARLEAQLEAARRPDPLPAEIAAAEAKAA